MLQKGKFAYSPLNKGLDESDKKEGILKRLKNIEDRTSTNIKDKAKGGDKDKDKNKDEDEDEDTSYSAAVTDENSNEYIKNLTPKEKNVFDELKKKNNSINYKNIYSLRGNGKNYDFRNYGTIPDLVRKLFYGYDIREAEFRDQGNLEKGITRLEAYRPKKRRDGKIDYTDLKKKLLENVNNLYHGIQITINAFKKGVFKIFNEKHGEDENFSYNPTELKQNFEESEGERVKLKRQEFDELNDMITKTDKIISEELFNRQFGFQSQFDMLA